MAFRFSRRIKLLPGVHLNLGLRSVSLSLGPRGAGVTIGPGGIHGNVGVPGTGLSYRRRLGPARGRAAVELPDAPRIHFDDHLGMELLDDDGNLLAEPILGATRKVFRARILEALDARAAEINAARGADDWPRLGSENPGGDTPLARVEARLGALVWPRETSMSFDAEGVTLRADVDLPEIEDLPASEVAVSRRDLALVAKPLSATARRRAYDRHICGIAARIIDQAFAVDPAFSTVEVAGYTQSPGSSGAADVYVLAAIVPRDLWAGPGVDPVAALAPFRRRTAVDAGGETHPVIPLARA